MVSPEIKETRYFQEIVSAISDTGSAEDWDFGCELIEEIASLIWDHRNEVAASEFFRRSARKKERNEITRRISINAEKLAKDLRKILGNPTLNREIIDIYQQVVSESTEPDLFPIVDNKSAGNIDIFEYQHLGNDFEEYDGYFRLICQLRALSEAVSRTNKAGFGLRTNKPSSLVKLSESINKSLLQQLEPDYEFEEVEKLERASIIHEIYSDIGLYAGSSKTIAKTIS